MEDPETGRRWKKDIKQLSENSSDISNLSEDVWIVWNSFSTNKSLNDSNRADSEQIPSIVWLSDMSKPKAR
jgi:hypothetical protein